MGLKAGLWLWLPWWWDSKETTCNMGDLGSFPGLGRSPGGWHGNLLQYSCLENPHGLPVNPQRSLAGYNPWSRKELYMTEWLSIAQHQIHRFHLCRFSQPLMEFLDMEGWLHCAILYKGTWTSVDFIHRSRGMQEPRPCRYWVLAVL